MKTILYATDYSENAENALKYAFLISSKLKAQLIVTHVFDLPTLVTNDIEASYLQLEKLAYKTHKTDLKEMCKNIIGIKLMKDKNVKIDPIEETSPVLGIISKAIETDALMIVVGMKGRTLINELLMGNTAKKLIEKAPCPVFAVPEKTASDNLNNIVYATDFEEEDLDAIFELSEIAYALDAKIKIIHVTKEKELMANQQMDWFKEMVKEKVSYKKISYEILRFTEIFDAIITYLETNEVDLIAMLERQANNKSKGWFHQDLVKKMATYAKTPLLSFNERNF